MKELRIKVLAYEEVESEVPITACNLYDLAVSRGVKLTAPEVIITRTMRLPNGKWFCPIFRVEPHPIIQYLQ